jgi:hypothetical protein
MLLIGKMRGRDLIKAPEWDPKIWIFVRSGS